MNMASSWKSTFHFSFRNKVKIQGTFVLCLGSCQLSRGFEESGNQSNKQINATFRKIIFHFQAKSKINKAQ